MATRNQQNQPTEPEAPRQDPDVADAAADAQKAQEATIEAENERIRTLEAVQAARSDAEARHAEEQARAAAQDAVAAGEEPRKDETVEGGRYLHNSILVNANGEPLAE
jgi:hypothetical protein